jgi:hypothetical protein
MTTKQIMLSLFFITNIVNGMDPDFNMEELIQCALNPKIELEKNRDCVNAGYLASTYFNPSSISSKDLTEKSKTGLANYFFKINKSFDPNNKYSNPYNGNIGIYHMRTKIDHAIGNHHEIFKDLKDHTSSNLSQKFNVIAKEYNGLKLHNDVDEILEDFIHTDDKFYNNTRKAIIKEHYRNFTRIYPIQQNHWFWEYTPWKRDYYSEYITTRLRAINTRWKNGQRQCTLSDSEIDKITEKIQQFE